MEEECEDGEYDLACENARLIVENERLREALRDAHNCFRVYWEQMPAFMHGEPIKAHMKRYAAALNTELSDAA